MICTADSVVYDFTQVSLVLPKALLQICKWYDLFLWPMACWGRRNYFKKLTFFAKTWQNTISMAFDQKEDFRSVLKLLGLLV